MSAEIIRHGKIVIDIESGKVDLKVPSLAPVIAEQKQAIDQQKQLTDAIKEAVKVEEQLAAKAVEAHKKAAEAAKRAAEQQQSATFAVTKNTVEALQGVNQLGEGFFLLARSVALFAGDSDEDLRKLIQTVATLQAGFDLVKGSIQIAQGLVQILSRLNEARKVQAAVTAAVATAEVAEAGAATAAAGATTGLAVALGTLAVPLTLVIAAVGAVAVAYKLLADSEEDAARKSVEGARAYAEGQRARAQATTQAIQTEIRDEQLILEMRRSRQTEQEKIASAQRNMRALDSIVRLESSYSGYKGDEASRQQSLKAAREAQIADIRAIEDAQQRISEAEKDALQTQIRSVQEQERALDVARKQLELEQQKVQSFEAQFGQLSRIEQERLKKIGQKVETGQELTRFEESELRRAGGDAGRRVADDIAAKRGKSQGADDVLRSLGGLSAFESAQSSANREQSKLSKLTDGLDAEAAVAKLEARVKKVQETSESMAAELDKTFRLTLDALKSHQDELRRLGQGATMGGR